MQPRLHWCGLALQCTAFAIIALAACGKDEKEEEPAAPTATATPTPARSATPAPTSTAIAETPLRPFWVASASSRLLSRFDATGTRDKTREVDLQYHTSLNRGGVTALAWLDASTLLAFVDPGDPSYVEFVTSIDPRTAALKNKFWYQDNMNLDEVEASGIVTGFIAKTILIQATKTSDQTSTIQRVLDSNGGGADGATFLSGTTLAACPHGTLKSILTIKHNGTRSVLALSAGSAQRLNVIGLAAGAATCRSSYDYGTDGLTTNADVPVAAVQMADTKIYVLYQNVATSKIVSYTYDGTALASPTLVFADQTILGAKPRALAARNSRRLLVSNPEKSKIYEVSIDGAFTGFLLQSQYVNDVVAILPEE